MKEEFLTIQGLSNEVSPTGYISTIIHATDSHRQMHVLRTSNMLISTTAYIGAHIQCIVTPDGYSAGLPPIGDIRTNILTVCPVCRSPIAYYENGTARCIGTGCYPQLYTKILNGYAACGIQFDAMEMDLVLKSLTYGGIRSYTDFLMIPEIDVHMFNVFTSDSDLINRFIKKICQIRLPKSPAIFVYAMDIHVAEYNHTLELLNGLYQNANAMVTDIITNGQLTLVQDMNPVDRNIIITSVLHSPSVATILAGK